jgi:Tfp pilus assembly ATPase PilU
MRPYSMSSYSIPDLLKQLQTERGERVRLDVGFPPSVVVKGEAHEIEGPSVTEESVEEMLRAVASTREMRAFRESGTVDVIVPFEGTRFLVRAVRAFSEFRLELQPIPV